MARSQRSRDQICSSHRSAYIAGNHASAAVSRKTGYVDNGTDRITQHTAEGKVGVESRRVLVAPETYIRPSDPITVDGTDALRRFLAIER